MTKRIRYLSIILCKTKPALEVINEENTLLSSTLSYSICLSPPPFLQSHSILSIPNFSLSLCVYVCVVCVCMCVWCVCVCVLFFSSI